VGGFYLGGFYVGVCEIRLSLLFKSESRTLFRVFFDVSFMNTQE